LLILPIKLSQLLKAGPFAAAATFVAPEELETTREL
jgi:hypothetical protein